MEKSPIHPARPGQRCFGLACYLLAWLGQAVFLTLVLCWGQGWEFPIHPFDLGNPWAPNLAWLALFGLQHSGMARAGFKQWLARWFPEALGRSLYTALSGALLLLLPLAWRTIPGEPWWRGPWWLQSISWAGALGVAWCCGAFDHFAFFGLRQAWTGQAEDTAKCLYTGGPYRLVRHPLMLGTLVFLWGHPVMTPTLALLAGGLTLYILAAIPLEERGLLQHFGGPYAEYQKRVPMLVPWKLPR